MLVYYICSLILFMSQDPMLTPLHLLQKCAQGFFLHKLCNMKLHIHRLATTLKPVTGFNVVADDLKPDADINILLPGSTFFFALPLSMHANPSGAELSSWSFSRVFLVFLYILNFLFNNKFQPIHPFIIYTTYPDPIQAGMGRKAGYNQEK